LDEWNVAMADRWMEATLQYVNIVVKEPPASHGDVL
jgi:hypothetical protein